MKHTAVNPYLPLDEYVPDGEPRLFDGRVYVYGSHDMAGGSFFCLGDYVAWSAPEDDLGDWRYEGVIYRKTQDPLNADGALELFAPDVVRGPDGRYYLYYCLRMVRRFSVAVSDSPAGPFEFCGTVHRQSGEALTEYMPYDPSVLVDAERGVYLYYGFSSEMLARRFDTEVSPGAMVVRLAPDMLTVLSEPALCVPAQRSAKGTSFEGHAYFEAPSMRRIGDTYYLVYSSEWCRELCYAHSARPDGGFVYGGVIVDNADLGFDGRELPAYIPGNNHGGLLRAGGADYFFYHRHTHATSFSRQGCAERVHILPDGSIPQAGLTSCGLNGGPLPAAGAWPAAIACHLAGAHPEQLLDFRNVDAGAIPFIREDANAQGQKEQYIHNFANGTYAGYKYFESCGAAALTLTLRGRARGVLRLALGAPDAPAAAQTPLSLDSADWTEVSLPCAFTGVQALYFTFAGTGSFDFLRFAFDAPGHLCERK